MSYLVGNPEDQFSRVAVHMLCANASLHGQITFSEWPMDGLVCLVRLQCDMWVWTKDKAKVMFKSRAFIWGSEMSRGRY